MAPMNFFILCSFTIIYFFLYFLYFSLHILADLYNIVTHLTGLTAWTVFFWLFFNIHLDFTHFHKWGFGRSIFDRIKHFSCSGGIFFKLLKVGRVSEKVGRFVGRSSCLASVLGLIKGFTCITGVCYTLPCLLCNPNFSGFVMDSEPGKL